MSWPPSERPWVEWNATRVRSGDSTGRPSGAAVSVTLTTWPSPPLTYTSGSGASLRLVQVTVSPRAETSSS
jgi:hypothetical protein